MRINWQSILGPAFWIAATYLAITYGPGLVSQLQGKTPVENGAASIERSLEQSILGQESENESQRDNKPILGKIIPDKLPATPQEVPQFVREIIERTTNTVIEKGQTEVEEKKTEVVKSACSQIITEIQKQCNISTSTQ